MANQKNNGSSNNGKREDRRPELRRGKNTLARSVAERRDADRANGSFYMRKNGDRSNDIFALEAGVEGEYAFPGGHEPSAHFIVSNRGTMEEPWIVIQFQGSHREHPLPGNLNTEVYTAVSLLGFESFTSRKTGEWGATQNAVWKYLTSLIDAAVASKNEAAHNELLLSGNKDLRGIFAAKAGDIFTVTLQKAGVEDGTILVEVNEEKGLKVIRVKASSFAPIRSDLPFYLAVERLRDESLTQRIPDELYAQQAELHEALRWVLSTLPEMEHTPAVKREPAPAMPVPVAPPVVENDDVSSEVRVKSDIDFTRSARLTPQLLMRKIKNGKPSVPCYIGNGNERVYFMRECVGGGQKLRLVKADDHSPLSALVESHRQGVDVEIREVIAGVADGVEIGDLAIMKNARLHLTAWINSKLAEIGYEAKEAAKD